MSAMYIILFPIQSSYLRCQTYQVYVYLNESMIGEPLPQFSPISSKKGPA